MTRVAFAGGKPPGIACFTKLLTHIRPDIVFVNAEDAQPQHWYSRPTLTELAQANAIPVRTTLSAADLTDIDLLLVVYYDMILPPEIIAQLPLGCVNLHLGLAEQYRGAYPTTWALLNGETVTGCTLHYIDAGIDSGPIIATRDVPITPDDTGLTLYRTLTTVGSALFDQWLPRLLTGRVESRPQQPMFYPKVHYKRDFPDYEVVLPETTRNRIRALTFPPFPRPYCMIGSRKFYFVDAQELTS